MPDKRNDPGTWLEVLKVVLMPVAVVGIGFLFNSSLNLRQQRDNNIRLYTEMMGRREEADSALRKDMFNSMLSTFLLRDPKLQLPRQERLSQDVLSLELLAYNFHDSLNIAPLFKDVRRRIKEQKDPSHLEHRLERIAKEVKERQLSALAASGTVATGDGPPEGEFTFGVDHTVPNHTPPVLCLSAAPPDISADSTRATQSERHYRWFTLRSGEYDAKRGIRVYLFVSTPIDKDRCMAGPKEGETPFDVPDVAKDFWVDLFDFPLIDNTRLSLDERCAVALIQSFGDDSSFHIALAYFPGSRASLREKPFYDDVMHELVHGHSMETERGIPEKNKPPNSQSGNEGQSGTQ